MTPAPCLLYILHPILFLAFATSSFAAEWNLAAPYPVASHLQSVALAPDGHPIAMGSFGNAAASGDGGASWVPLKVPTTRSLHQVMFRAGIGHAVGDGGTILVSGDGGHSWEPQSSGLSDDLYGIDFRDQDQGVACGTGGTLLFTTDGGHAWRLARPDNSIRFHRVQYTGQGAAVMAASGGVYRTLNAGATVEHTLVHPLPFFSLDFPDSVSGYAASYGTLWRTRDGGRSWDSLFYTSVISEVQAFGPDSLNVYGPSGLRGRSRDGGNTWDTYFDWETRDMLSTRFVDGLIGFGAGNNGNIFATADGGLTWAARRRSSPVALHSEPCFFDGVNGYALGAAGLMHTGDGGLTWAEVIEPVASLAVNGIHIADARVAYGVGNAGAVVKTSDAGRTWARLNAGTDRNLASVWFPKADTGWIVGKGVNSLILKTVDGGAHWQAQTNPAQSPLSLLRFVDTRRGYALGSYDQILSTNNGGQDWTLTATKAPHALGWLDFPDASTGYARGISDSGTVLLKSVNGGATWTPRYLEDYLQWFHFTDRDTGYAAGYTRGPEAQGLILRTTDGGESWSRSETATPELNMVFVPEHGKAVAMGPYGTVLTHEEDASAHVVGMARSMRGGGSGSVTRAWPFTDALGRRQDATASSTRGAGAAGPSSYTGLPASGSRK